MTIMIIEMWITLESKREKNNNRRKERKNEGKAGKKQIYLYV
jgi:hypothetical protein